MACVKIPVRHTLSFIVAQGDFLVKGSEKPFSVPRIPISFLNLSKPLQVSLPISTLHLAVNHTGQGRHDGIVLGLILEQG